jgi:hypothetical protein
LRVPPDEGLRETILCFRVSPLPLPDGRQPETYCVGGGVMILRSRSVMRSSSVPTRVMRDS